MFFYLTDSYDEMCPDSKTSDACYSDCFISDKFFAWNAGKLNCNAVAVTVIRYESMTCNKF